MEWDEKNLNDFKSGIIVLLILVIQRYNINMSDLTHFMTSKYIDLQKTLIIFVLNVIGIQYFLRCKKLSTYDSVVGNWYEIYVDCENVRLVLYTITRNVYCSL